LGELGPLENGQITVTGVGISAVARTSC
jgi:hypothetical protein